jgi:hypothetical protein
MVLKKGLLIGVPALLGVVLWLSAAEAGVPIPDHVLRVDQLERARELAAAQNKALAFVLTDEHSDCGLCRRASLDAFEWLRQRAVLVYVGRDDIGRVPRLVYRALRSEAAGRYIPKTAVLDRELQRVIAVVPYADQARHRSLLQRAERRILEFTRRHARQRALADLERISEARAAAAARAEDEEAAAAGGDAAAVAGGDAAAAGGDAAGAAAGDEAAAAAGRQRHAVVSNGPDAPAPAPEPAAGHGIEPELTVHWGRSLGSGPERALGGWFRDQGIPMQGRCREQDCRPAGRLPGEKTCTVCRFRVTRPVGAAHFQTELQIFLNAHYRLLELDAESEQIEAWLAPR